MGADFIRGNLEITQISPKMASRENGNVYANSVQNEENCQLPLPPPPIQQPGPQQPPAPRQNFYYDSPDSHSPYSPNGLANAVSPSAANGPHDLSTGTDRYGVTAGLTTATDSVSQFLSNCLQ